MIDFTAATEDICGHVKRWKVQQENENLTVHNTITFEFEWETNTATTGPLNGGKRGWHVEEMSLKNFTRECREMLRDEIDVTPEMLVNGIIEKCNENFRKRNKGYRGRNPAYLAWNSDIATKRNECIKERVQEHEQELERRKKKG
ncbi:unnamed protein product [Ceutorhynchus assimilis]|uniref:Uncharacterized protein n=1 Tax=Ceutorhynchus assimilis TaxID=467358 RepID=A0A9N9MJJ5_9CUCU|nr:unnamed protein product [Ceutorhynchus assimilis]